MNMLNNIHGMVEMDPARAQVMIMELSKLMRYVLYEGANPRTLLSRETDFIASYVELMRKRYSSWKVRISLEQPERNREHVFLPPLLFISVIENAFKHGISYQSPSFVEIRLCMEKDTLRLDCVNSVHRRPPRGTAHGRRGTCQSKAAAAAALWRRLHAGHHGEGREDLPCKPDNTL